MKLYVVIEDDYECGPPNGIFDTLDAAKTFALSQKGNPRDWEVWEYELNKEYECWFNTQRVFRTSDI